VIRTEHLFVLAGLFFAAIAVTSFLDRSNARRLINTAFWGLLGAAFLFGSHLSDFGNGLIALGLVVVGGVFRLGRGVPSTTSEAERAALALRRGNWIFVPALMVPAAALLGTLWLKGLTVGGAPLMETRSVTLLSLFLGVLLALAVVLVWMRPPLSAPVQEGRRLLDAVGWAVILPQMLACLGAIFAVTGVGEHVGELFKTFLSQDNRFLIVVCYCVGMAAFTVIMGNAFAAFPIMTAAIGLPLIVHVHGGNPVIMAALGMLAGFCGTLTTPMAANFNLVPAALLELKDRYGVIRAQIPTALPLLLGNTLLMYLLVFR
jgi:uncharacterized membrane protein